MSIHKAPAVGFWVGRSRCGLVTVIVFLTLASAALLALAQSLESVFSRIALLVSLIFVAVVSLGAWWFSESGMLQWDGGSWHFSGWPGIAVERLTPVLDLQFLMLVELTSCGGKTAWLWIESRQCDPRWQGLRRALVSSQNSRGEESDRLDI